MDLLLPRFLLIPEILRGADVVDGPARSSSRRPIAGGTARTMQTSTRSRWRDYNAWAGGYGLHLPVDPDVGYLARQEEPLWFDDVGR